MSADRLHRALLAVLLVGLGLVPAAFAETTQRYASVLPSHLFPVSKALEPNIEFWKSVFSRYNSNQVVLHDEWDLSVVYEVVELADLEESGLSEVQLRRARRDRVRAAEQRLRSLLRALGSGQTIDEDEARRLEALWSHEPEGRQKYQRAAVRVRSQTGLRDTFANAIEISGMFMPGIEAVLREEGVPVEISRMPFVESMFNYQARSKVGASGAWQFTLSTGRLFLQIDSAVDERSDVLLAARGAARLLKKDEEKLGAWPLALTAYNHGSAGIARAVSRLGTRDMGEIATSYRSRTFGFASRNFYAEFVAAAAVYAERERLFPDVKPHPPLSFDQFLAPRYVSLPHLAREAEVDLALLKDLNPALSGEVYRGTLMVPKGYPLRVPQGTMAKVAEAYDGLPGERKRDRQTVTGYRVRPGDTLGIIAQRFGTTVSRLQSVNALASAHRIYVGQRLIIPEGRYSGPRIAASPPPANGIHVVERGENVNLIARRYGISESAVVAANGLRQPDLLQVGQRLRIPEAPGSAGSDSNRESEHVVRRGETLFRIAASYGTTVDAIMQLNRLRSSLIRAGQRLRIP